MPSSPIERMIDEACGVPDGFHALDGHVADNDWLILLCPKCGRFIAVERQPEIDPATATLLELNCDNRCWEEGSESFYYDQHGRWLGPDDWPAPAPTPAPKGERPAAGKEK